MALIERVYPWTTQPQEAVAPNPRLRAPSLIWCGGSWGIGAMEDNVGGRGLRLSSSGYGAPVADEALQVIASGQDSVTISVLRTSLDATPRSSMLFGSSPSSGNRVLAHAPWSDGNIYWDYGDSTSGSGRISTAYTKSTGGIDILTFVADTGRREIWRNGRLLVSGTGTAHPMDMSYPFYVGAQPGVSNADDEIVYLLVVQGLACTEREILDWHADPYAETFAPLRTTVPTSAAGGSLPTLSAATYMPGSLTSSGFRPRVTAS